MTITELAFLTFGLQTEEQVITGMMRGTFQQLYTKEPKMASFTESQKFLHPHLSFLKRRHRHYTSLSTNAVITMAFQS